MDVNKYYLECPNCQTKVDALKQLVDVCFFEDGEAQFMVEEGCGLWLHTIFCPKCGARWGMSIGGMELKSDQNIGFNDILKGAVWQKLIIVRMQKDQNS